MRHRRTLLGTIVTCGCVMFSGTVAAQGAGTMTSVGRLVRVSYANPYAGGCGAGPVRAPNADSEPVIAADPLDPRRIVVAWHSGARRGGGFVDDFLARSGDGGRTWRRTVPPATTVCNSSRRADRNSDPTLSWGPDGRLYFASLPGRLDQEGFPITAALVHTSTDGIHWSRPAPVRAGGFHDRETIKADPRKRGVAYETWVARSGPARGQGVLMFARTRDGGRHWRAAAILRPPFLHVPINATVVPLPDGTLIDCFISYQPTPRWPIEVMKSRDHGRTWSPPRTIGTAGNMFPRDPQTGTSTNMLPISVAAAGPHRDAYVVWNDNRSTRSTRVSLARTLDDGHTWSRPRSIKTLRTQSLLPAVAVTDAGTVGVTWYDFRRDRRSTPGLTTDVWFASSPNRGTTWRERHLAGPFNMLAAYKSQAGPDEQNSGTGSGLYLGDYTGLTAIGTGFGAALSLATPYAPRNLPDIWFVPIRMR